MHDQVTVVVGIDAKTIEQLAVSCETWRRHRPEMWTMPWIVFWDWTQLTRYDIESIRARLAVPNLRLVEWPQVGWSPKSAYESQREFMLSGFVHVPAQYCETAYWMKIDTDAVAHNGKTPLFDREWLDIQPCGRRLAWIASPWSYSKPAEQPGQLDAWGDGIPELHNGPRLNLTPEPGAKRIGHPRMASWLSFYSREFTIFAADLARRSCGAGRLPVPSQDGYHFYVANRSGWPFKLSKMKRRGWSNVPRLTNLISISEMVMSQGIGVEG